MAYEDAVQLPNGAWFDITAFRARVLLLNATNPRVPDDGRIKLASGQTFDVELMVARLGLADGGTALATADSLHGIRLPNGNVYDALDLNRRLVARDGGATCFLTRIGSKFTRGSDDVKLKVTPGGFLAGGDGSGTAPVTPSPLGPLTASFSVGATSGSLITAITGLSSGETIASVSPNDGRVAISSGSSLLVGLTASAAGTISYTLTTSTGRTLTIAVTASAAGTVPANALLDVDDSPMLDVDDSYLLDAA